MTRRQIDQSREVRLWVTQVIGPVIGLAFLIPESRKAIVNKVKDVSTTIKEKVRKKKEEE